MKAARALLAILMLAILAVPFWPRVIDDLFISIAYAREWLDSGQLRWTSGEVVEGYSNFLWVVALLPWLASGVDPTLGAKVMSFAAGAAFVACLSGLLPRDARGALPLIAVVNWSPFAYWSMSGMETTTFALLAPAGWALAARSAEHRGAAVALLVVASLVRPEGHAWAVAAVIGSLATHGATLRRSDAIGVGAVLLLGAYHAVRIAHFGDVWPTPAIVKIGGAGPALAGFSQLGQESLTAMGAVAALTLFRYTDRRVAWVVAPLILHAALLVRLGGDWMAWGRMLVPGVLGASLTAAAIGDLRPINARTAVVAGLVAIGALLECRQPWEGGLALRTYSWPQAGFETPAQVDVEWIVENVPDGGTVMTSDVGIVGNIPGVRIRDSSGLVDRACAEIRSGQRPFVKEEWLDAYGGAAGQIGAVRILGNSASAAGLDAWMLERLPRRELVHGADPERIWQTAAFEPPSREVVNRRWKALAQRFPGQPWLAWRALLARADAGGAITPDTAFTSGVVPLSFEADRGFGLFWDGTLVSRPLERVDLEHGALVLDVDDPGEEGARVRVRAGSCETVAVVKARTTMPVPSLCASLVPGDRISATFENDAAGDGTDRNVYVDLVR